MKVLSQGIKIEAEHRGTLKYLKRYYKAHRKFPTPKQFYKSIAVEHIKEDPRYYLKLRKAKL